jgi:hypothetical protein
MRRIRVREDNTHKSSIELREMRRDIEVWLTGVPVTAAVGSGVSTMAACVSAARDSLVTPMVPVAVTWAWATPAMSAATATTLAIIVSD